MIGPILSLAFIVQMSWAKPTPKPADQVLDFEGDVIEGERDRPDIFVQLGARPTADSILFLRKDFNDFHAPSRRTRPLFFERPGSAGGKK